VASDSEVLPLQPKLKELDHLYFAEKKGMTQRLRDLFVDMSAGGQKSSKKQKKSAAAMLGQVEGQGLSRLEEECSKMGAQVEGVHFLCL
jgi:hypothetical protein